MPKVKSTDLRRKARMVALQCLFATDIKGTRDDSALEWLIDEEPVPAVSAQFAKTLLRGVMDHSPDLDNVIQRYAPAWPVKQLPLVDRNILRIALFELLYNPNTPRKTAVNEAVELAKVFGSESSARFVNGVLGSVMAGPELAELTPGGATPEGR
jgi:N utilization substance protein B